MSPKTRARLLAFQWAGLALTGVLFNMSVLAATGSSSNLGFLNNTPIAYMRQADIASLRDAIYVTLDSTPDGATRAWNNQGLGNHVAINADLKPEQTMTHDQRTCRRLVVALRAKGQLIDLHPRYCRESQGKWQLQKRN
jgi:surface antigen